MGEGSPSDEPLCVWWGAVGSQRVVWQTWNRGGTKRWLTAENHTANNCPWTFQTACSPSINASDHRPQLFIQEIWFLGVPRELTVSPLSRSRNMAILVVRPWGTCFSSQRLRPSLLNQQIETVILLPSWETHLWLHYPA